MQDLKAHIFGIFIEHPVHDIKIVYLIIKYIYRHDKAKHESVSALFMRSTDISKMFKMAKTYGVITVVLNMILYLI